MTIYIETPAVQTAFSKRWRFPMAGSGALIGACVALSVSQGQPAPHPAPSAPPAASSPNAILQQAIDTYHKFRSYHGEANIDSELLDAKGRVVKRLSSSVSMQYKQPNKLQLSFTTPTGSREVYDDGTHFVVYNPIIKRFTTDKVPLPTHGSPSLNDMLPLLFRRAGATASLDPLYFLSEKTLPKQLTNLRIKETSALNGHNVYVITGLLNITPANVHAQGNGRPTSTWTFWLDRDSHLLYKVQMESSPFSVVAQNAAKKPVTLVLHEIMRHTISEAQPNSNISDDVFVFHTPKDAIERKTTPASLTGQ